MKEKTLSVSAIKEGTVIDHIQAGQALKIIRLLRAEEKRVTMGLNLKSQSMGLKDIIKIENVFLTESQAGQIAIFSPSATVNVIENYQVAKKFNVKLPEAITGALACPSPRCITNGEKIPTLFTVEENNSHVTLFCKYCEKFFSRDEMHEKV
ncbi:MAG TPA: aspartate carbamoyltransferase regulatory subunit [Chlamydiales bacterium]|nr:aspartate carbamoyltransferase regulatory subunit [Chlamydiales bacterium]